MGVVGGGGWVGGWVGGGGGGGGGRKHLRSFNSTPGRDHKLCQAKMCSVMYTIYYFLLNEFQNQICTFKSPRYLMYTK